MAIQKYLNKLLEKSPKIDAIILGCTHYAIIENKIKKFLAPNINLISQGPIVAEKLKDYLKRHPEIEKKLDKSGKRIFLTTENSARIKRLSNLFYGEIIDIKTIELEN